MALFGFGKDKREGGGNLDLVLAYLEDLQRSRALVSVFDARQKEGTGVISQVDEHPGTFQVQLQGPLPGAAKGDKVDLIFMQDALRIGGSSRIMEVRGSQLVMELPENLEMRDRRKEVRARLLSKEGATVTALTGLFEGFGLTGTIDNVSESGARVRVEKAMSIPGEKRLNVGLALVQPGQDFVVVKLNNVPKCPPSIEICGKAVYLEQGPGGLYLGLRFPKPEAPLARFTRGRSSAAPTSVPMRSRRKARMAEEEPEAPGVEPAPTLPSPAPAPAPAPIPTPLVPPDPGPERRVEPTDLPEVAPEHPVRSAPNPLVRMKKRSRAAVILAPPAKVEALREVLEEDGYGRILIGTTADEIRKHLAQPNLGFLLMDLDTSVLDCLQFLILLKQEFPDCPPIIMAAHDISKAIVVAAQRAGASQLIIKPYVLDEHFLAQLEGWL